MVKNGGDICGWEFEKGDRANVTGCKDVGRVKRARRPCTSNVAALGRKLFIMVQSVPRSKHTTSQLEKPVS